MKKINWRNHPFLIGLAAYLGLSLVIDSACGLIGRLPIFAFFTTAVGDGGSMLFSGVGYFVWDSRPSLVGGSVNFHWGWTVDGGLLSLLSLLPMLAIAVVFYALSKLVARRKPLVLLIVSLLAAAVFLVYLFSNTPYFEFVFRIFVRSLFGISLFAGVLRLCGYVDLRHYRPETEK